MSNIQRRSGNKTYYNYCVFNINSQSTEYYKTVQHITDKYQISRANIYLMCKNPDVIRRKYNDLKIKKVHLHYLVVEQNIKPEMIH